MRKMIIIERQIIRNTLVFLSTLITYVPSISTSMIPETQRIVQYICWHIYDFIVHLELGVMIT